MAELICAVCRSPNAKSCGTCKAIYYCSKDCQALDWYESHKLVCNEYSKFIVNNPRPIETADILYKLGILFPVDEKKPKLIWIKLYVHREQDTEKAAQGKTDYTWHEMDTTVMGKSFSIYADPAFTGFNGRGRRYRLAKCLQIWHRINFHGEESQVSQCVRHVLKYLHVPMMFWRGPLLALRTAENKLVSFSRYEDATLADLRYAVGFLKTHSNMVPPIGGVRINGVDEMARYKRNCYEGLIINSFQSINYIGTTSRISEHMGLPLILYYNPSKKNVDIAKLNLDGPSSKASPCFMLMGADWHDSDGWAAPVDIKHASGTYEVMRKDGKNITQHQVMAIAVFCQSVLFKLMKLCRDEEDRKHTIKSYMCQSAFEEFLKGMNDKGDISNTSWVKIVSPYRV
jgi:hypothetical protein